MDKSVALIGGNGFIGKNLTNYFLEKDYNVLVIGRNIVEDSDNLNGKLINKLIDVNKTSKLIDVLFEYENIIWLVNDLVPGSTMDCLVDDFTFNITPLINFLESVKKLIILKRFVFISSGGTIYGDSLNRTDLNEDSPKNPISAYGLSKIIAENYINFITKRSSFESIIIRPSNVYGNHQNFKKPQGIVGYAFNALVNNKTIELYGEGKVIRDFVHVLDLAEAIKCCIERKCETATVKTYNVGSQAGYSVKEVLDMINEISNQKIQTTLKPSRSFDCSYNVLDISKIKNELKWQPKVEIKDGLRRVWEWINNGDNNKLNKK
jgi:UDP-glucose 4-epimerase